MKIVKFKDGTYAVRRFELSFGWCYYDASCKMWWPFNNVKSAKCSIEEARLRLEQLTDKGTPIGWP
jgi:hypothetical protein